MYPYRTVMWNIHNVGILHKYGNDTFAAIKIYSTGPSSTPRSISVSDFNNDNILDIVVTNSGTSKIVLLYGNGTFGKETSYSLGYNYHPYSIAVKDLNQDNWMNIVITWSDTDHIDVIMFSFHTLYYCYQSIENFNTITSNFLPVELKKFFSIRYYFSNSYK
jgi:hypothetical protein